ncbi:hypothetical protein AB1Y20_013150 [Prymnesium parvum]|uniref:Uncharacterized protein n=1 Tax=Prymnesium parvum TaxID=97485 RepID=A0AB34IKN1_PRYPA
MPEAALPSSLTRLLEFRDRLTLPLTPAGRAVQSSGGVAGGVVSEGQGYGLLLAGLTLTSEARGSAGWQAALLFGEELFAGWRRMCELTRHGCQDDAQASGAACGGKMNKRTGERTKGIAACLPAWRFDESLRAQQSPGSATDGDEDALLGLILLISASDANAWPLWHSAVLWAFETARAFLRYNTIEAPRGLRGRLPRLGSCWGGFDCNNPSYIAPAHYRAFRHFMLRYAHLLDAVEEAEEASEAWEALYVSSYKLLAQAQCPSTGLTPNWWVPASNGGLGWPGCNSSGTRADEFGSEASRGVWRVALDALWSAGPSSTAPFGAHQYTARVAAHLVHLLTPSSSSGFANLETGCHIHSIHPDWYWNAFLYGPLSASLLLPLSSHDAKVRANQQAALGILTQRVGAARISDYYSGSWVALSTATLNGDARRACALLFGEEGGCSAERRGLGGHRNTSEVASWRASRAARRAAAV